MVFALALLIFALFLPPFSLLTGNGDAEELVDKEVCNGVTSSLLRDVPAPPQGLVLLSEPRELRANQQPCGPVDITINLTTQTEDPNNIGFFAYAGGQWQRVAEARLTAEGRAAEGRLEQLPPNLAVLRQVGFDLHVEGWLAPGAALDPDGADLLTVLNPVDFAPVADGSIAGSLSGAPADGAALVPTVRADSDEETLAVETILATEAVRQRHIDELVSLVLTNDLDGLELDYGPLDPGLRTDFTTFVTGLAQQLHEAGKVLNIVLPLPEGSGPDLSTGAYDYQSLGELADFLKLTAEMDPSLYRQRMTEVLSFATETARVPPSKLLLVISPYSVEKGPQGLRPVTLREALTRAGFPTVEAENPSLLASGSTVTLVGKRIDPESTASGVAWSDADLAVRFTYAEGGNQFTYWLENFYSLGFKLDLVQRFRLAGVAVLDASDDERLGDVWQALRDFSETGAPTLLKPNPQSLVAEWWVDGQPLPEGQGPRVRWTAPSEAGNHEVVLIVSDGVVRLGSRITVQVAEAQPTPTPEEGATGTPTPTATP